MDLVLPLKKSGRFEGNLKIWKYHPTSTSASCFEAHLGLRSVFLASTLALVLDEHFGLRFKFGGGLQTSSFKVLDCFSLWALTRAVGFPARFGRPGCHQHRLVGSVTALQAGADAHEQQLCQHLSAVKESC